MSSRWLCKKQVDLRIVAFLRGLGQLVGNSSARLACAVALSSALFSAACVSVNCVLRLRQVIFASWPVPFWCWPVRFAPFPCLLCGVALGNQRVDFVVHHNKVQRAGGERRDNGHNQTDANQHDLI